MMTDALIGVCINRVYCLYNKRAVYSVWGAWRGILLPLVVNITPAAYPAARPV
jgi:hypothetical protein